MKRLLDEAESDALEDYLAVSECVLMTSALSSVEVPRAVAIGSRDADPVEVERLLKSCRLMTISAGVLRSAARLASPQLRTLDAIHLASALHAEVDELLAYDHRLLAAAKAHGLATASPGATFD